MANPFFDAAYYLSRNPDVVAAGYTLANAEQHYIKYGAAESINSASRAPNAWFDARAYLLAYPDLVANGITAANAFQHYITYGINEGRSPTPNLNPTTFSYTDYANANADVRAAFGISDTTHLTADQQHQLLGHFLSYGIHESRPGIESTDGTGFFAQFDTRPPVNSAPAAPIPIDGTHGDHIYSGTSDDDVFNATAPNLNGATVNGAAGNDTLKGSLTGISNIAFTANGIENIQFDGNGFFGTVTVTGSGVNSLTVSGAPSLFSWIGPNPHVVNIKTNGTVVINPNDSSGPGGHIAANVDAGKNGDIYFNGVERIDMVIGDHANVNMTIGGLGLVSTTGTVNLSGGASDYSFTLEVPVGSSPRVTDAVVNGSLATGNQTIGFGNSFGGNYNVTITGGSGNDTLSDHVDAAHTSTLNGGGGNDILFGSGGLDLLTGGSGDDIFRFRTGEAVPIDLATGKVDTILDLAAGDTIEFAGAGVGASNYVRSDATLALAVAGVEAAIGATNTNAIFTLGTQAYFINSGDGVTPAAIIKLVMADNSPFTGQMIPDANGAHFV